MGVIECYRVSIPLTMAVVFLNKKWMIENLAKEGTIFHTVDNDYVWFSEDGNFAIVGREK